MQESAGFAAARISEIPFLTVGVKTHVLRVGNQQMHVPAATCQYIICCRLFIDNGPTSKLWQVRLDDYLANSTKGMEDPVAQPVSNSCWKIPGYTGYVRGLAETIGSTPVSAQHKAAAPAPGDFLHTRQFITPSLTPSRDPCNFPEALKVSGEPVNLWPTLQSTGRLCGRYFQ